MILITWFDGLDVIKVLLKIFALVFDYNFQGILATSASRKTQKKKKKKVRKGMFKEFESRKCILCTSQVIFTGLIIFFP